MLQQQTKTCLVAVAFVLAFCSTSSSDTLTDVEVCRYATKLFSSNSMASQSGVVKRWESRERYQRYVEEAKRRGLSCGVRANSPLANHNESSKSLNEALLEAKKLRDTLAKLQIEKDRKKKAIREDKENPIIKIESVKSAGKQAVILGVATDDVGIAEISVDGEIVAFSDKGNFTYKTFVPVQGLTVIVQATDMAGQSSTQSVLLTRETSTISTKVDYARLNPIGKPVKKNADGLALIVGVSKYENTPIQAVFADADALMFRDYASEKLGIPDSRIKTMVNDNADIRELLLSVKNWLSRSVKQDQSDVYIFFAGHGLASDDGSKMYLLPYDGAPELLDDTAILRDRLFSDVAAANPRSVTVFLDTCYSGTTRGTDMLIASRPIAIRALEQSIPDNFTVMTAAAGDQTAKPLEEAKHGMFSYFLMKGMEGEADANNDNEITAGELHSYVETNVIQQSSGSQKPELHGDADRILVRFQ